jgi:hypothetical protein
VALSTGFCVFVPQLFMSVQVRVAMSPLPPVSQGEHSQASVHIVPLVDVVSLPVLVVVGLTDADVMLPLVVVVSEPPWPPVPVGVVSPPPPQAMATNETAPPRATAVNREYSARVIDTSSKNQGNPPQRERGRARARTL